MQLGMTLSAVTTPHLSFFLKKELINLSDPPSQNELTPHNDLILLDRESSNSGNYHSQPGVVLTLADFPTCLYMVTSVKGSPRMPSWIAHERKRMLLAASADRKGVAPSSR